jgi:hypothetical protein
MNFSRGTPLHGVSIDSIHYHWYMTEYGYLVCWNDNYQVKTKVLGGKPVPLPLGFTTNDINSAT